MNCYPTKGNQKPLTSLRKVDHTWNSYRRALKLRYNNEKKTKNRSERQSYNSAQEYRNADRRSRRSANCTPILHANVRVRSSKPIRNGTSAREIDESVRQSRGGVLSWNYVAPPLDSCVVFRWPPAVFLLSSPPRRAGQTWIFFLDQTTQLRYFTKELEMESYTSDSSDSDSASRTLDLSHLQLDSRALHEHLARAASPASVESLLLQRNRLSHLPDSAASFANLATLDVSSCGLTRLPDFLGELAQLVHLSAKNNGLTNDSLPKGLEGLPKLRELNLSGNRLTEFPEQLLGLPGLRYLYLGGNLIGEVTKDVWKIRSLQVLSLGGNRLTEVPSTLGQLTALQALVLCDNRLESLPNSIANLKNLKSLLLHKNVLKTLPTEIITLRNLTELSLRDNPLVVRFVTDMTHNPPSLLELAARVVKTHEIPYKAEDLPRNLLCYLDSAHHCVNPRCRGVFFDNRVEHVKFVDFCGKYRLPLLQYLCSSKCIGPREGNEEVVSGAMIRKVLLG